MIASETDRAHNGAWSRPIGTDDHDNDDVHTRYMNPLIIPTPDEYAEKTIAALAERLPGVSMLICIFSSLVSSGQNYKINPKGKTFALGFNIL